MEAVSLTSARPARSELVRARQRRYLASMLLRSACFVLMVAVPAPLPVKGALAFAAIAIPYVAVVVANQYAVRRSSPAPPSPVAPTWAPRALQQDTT